MIRCVFRFMRLQDQTFRMNMLHPKAGHKQGKRAALKRSHKTDSNNFIEEYRCFRLQVSHKVSRNDFCATDGTRN